MNKIYDKKCIEKCANIPVPRCPYEACMANCKRTNCVSRCSDNEKKPILICENQCKELRNLRLKYC